MRSHGHDRPPNTRHSDASRVRAWAFVRDREPVLCAAGASGGAADTGIVRSVPSHAAVHHSALPVVHTAVRRLGRMGWIEHVVLDVGCWRPVELALHVTRPTGVQRSSLGLATS